MQVRLKDLLTAFEWCVVGYVDASTLKRKEPEVDIKMTSKVVPMQFDSLRRRALDSNSLADWRELRKAIRKEILEKYGEKFYSPAW